MSNHSTPTSPTDRRDTDDPGDAMQRNVRYQHAYGVVLLVAAIRSQLPYISLWCEHHDDYLAERNDGLYDAFQVKTATPEDGEWVWSKDGLRDSVKRFVKLHAKFPDKIGKFTFVSNVKCLTSHAAKQIKRSPPLLLAAIGNNGTLDGELKQAFEELQNHCECTEINLREVLRRVNLQTGPGRDSFNEEIAHRHLPELTHCRNMTVIELDACLDSLVQIISRASSLDVRDPSRHWCAVVGDDRADPYLRAKRVLVSSVVEILRELKGPPFRYSQAAGLPKLGKGEDYLSALEKKLVRGGLSEYVGLLSQRAESAERHLLEMNAAHPEAFDGKFNQICSVVKNECEEARLAASATGKSYGEVMLRDVHARLRQVSESRSEMVCGEQYELLAGLAGLLTGDCKVWWSEKFNVEEAA